GRGNFADVADLSAGLAVEGRLIEDQRSPFARLEPLDLDAILDDRLNHAFRALGLVAEEIGRSSSFAQSVPDRFSRGFARARPGAARFRALALHRRLETVDVYREATSAQGILGKIERKAVSVVKPEGGLAAQHAVACERARLVLENGETPRQRRAKASL